MFKKYMLIVFMTIFILTQISPPAYATAEYVKQFKKDQKKHGQHAAQHHKFTRCEIEDFGDEVDETPAYSDNGVDASARYSRNRILDNLREKCHPPSTH